VEKITAVDRLLSLQLIT